MERNLERSAESASQEVMKILGESITVNGQPLKDLIQPHELAQNAHNLVSAEEALKTKNIKFTWDLPS